MWHRLRTNRETEMITLRDYQAMSAVSPPMRIGKTAQVAFIEAPCGAGR